MTYIPIVIPPQASQPSSPRTRELAGLLTKVLEEYQKAHPSVTGAEMRAAIRMVQRTTGKDRTANALVLSLVLGLMVAGLAVGLVAGDGGAVDLGGSMPMVILAATVFLGIILAVIKIASK